ncbi:DUF1211 domain-containing protein [Patescibacteria group bacterium]|nr:DUF1211 domain-containing protein [Patescibacteria group bacterium]MBU1673534.1 DUF1211 domain-containing protein [Patescibacteria group bacterium]MBU1963718.1 DUF1211 domain-containing protein [Patescibacteria group bacterium]
MATKKNNSKTTYNRFTVREGAWVRSKKNTDRIIYFSDAVFAIAITILILQIEIPTSANNSELVGDVLDMWPLIFSYLISFLVIGRYWFNHLHLCNYLKRVDRKWAMLNLAFLLSITFIPFPTEMYGTHPEKGFALALYALSISLAALLGGLLWRYAYKNADDLVYRDVDKRLLKYGWRQRLTVAISFLIVTPCIFISETFVYWFWPLYVAVNIIAFRILKHIEKKNLQTEKK